MPSALLRTSWQDFILPLIFFKRLSDVFEDEFQQYVEQYGGEDAAHAIIEADHRDALREGRRPIVRFYIPREYRRAVVAPRRRWPPRRVRH